MVAAGELGEIRVVQAEYAQDWLSTDLEATGHKQADWRTDPGAPAPAARSATSARMPTTSRASSPACELGAVSADLPTFVAGRRLDDNVHMLLRFDDGARGMLWASQVAPGNENALRCASTAARPASRCARSTPTSSGSRRWAAAAADHPRRGRCRRGRGARDAHPGRPSRGLSRSLRPALPRRGRTDPGAPGAARARPAGLLGADRRGRRARHEVHRGGGRVEPSRRPLGRRAPVAAASEWTRHRHRHVRGQGAAARRCAMLSARMSAECGRDEIRVRRRHFDTKGRGAGDLRLRDAASAHQGVPWW